MKGPVVLLRKKCRLVRTSFVLALFRHLYFRIRGKTILTSNRVRIQGLEQITVNDVLTIGLSHYGFMNKHDRTFLNVEGELLFSGRYSIAKGCRFEVGDQAKVELGRGYMSPNTDVIIMHGLKIGEGCAISWGCQFLDDDFHELTYEGQVETANQHIEIGDHVWIGSRVTILKGSVVPEGCVVAANTVVNRAFTEKNCLLAGSPAKIVKRDVKWDFESRPLLTSESK